MSCDLFSLARREMKTDSRLATLEPSSMIRGSHDCLEKVLWALRTRKGWPPVYDEKRHTVYTGNSIESPGREFRRRRRRTSGY